MRMKTTTTTKLNNFSKKEKKKRKRKGGEKREKETLERRRRRKSERRSLQIQRYKKGEAEASARTVATRMEGKNFGGNEDAKRRQGKVRLRIEVRRGGGRRRRRREGRRVGR